MPHDSVTRELREKLRTVLALHFDPDSGSPYWLRRARELDFDPRRQIKDIADLALLGPMPQEDLANTPVADFVPRSRQRPGQLLVAQTGGTLGDPKFAVYGQDEFFQAFVQPFLSSARAVDFPREENWLYVGPTGPHIIGRAAEACARAMGAPAPFMVDFDPRWARKLVPGSFARKRYDEHIVEQALYVIQRQRIGVIFSTPPVLAGLGSRISPELRSRVKGVHFGGMPISEELRFRLRNQFQHAVMLSGFGNTLLGMAPEVGYELGQGIDYAPHGLRLVIRLIPPGDQDTTERLARVVPYQERGQVLAHRLDETQLIVNLLERDTGVRIPPPNLDPELGFRLDGLRDPQPLAATRMAATSGLY